MISAAGIKDQELTIIVSMMLIELALLRLSRFKRLALLDTQGLKLLVALHPRVWRGTIRLGQEASSKAPNTPNLETAHHLVQRRPRRLRIERIVEQLLDPGVDVESSGCVGRSVTIIAFSRAQ
jgi:hypothetical protein